MVCVRARVSDQANEMSECKLCLIQRISKFIGLSAVLYDTCGLISFPLYHFDVINNRNEQISRASERENQLRNTNMRRTHINHQQKIMIGSVCTVFSTGFTHFKNARNAKCSPFVYRNSFFSSYQLACRPNDEHEWPI